VVFNMSSVDVSSCYIFPAIFIHLSAIAGAISRRINTELCRNTPLAHFPPSDSKSLCYIQVKGESKSLDECLSKVVSSDDGILWKVWTLWNICDSDQQMAVYI